MFKHITTKYCAGLITAAILVVAPRAEATLFGTLQVGANPVFDLTTTGGVAGANPSFNFTGTVNGVQLITTGASSNSPGTTPFSGLFDSSVQVFNDTALTLTLRFVFTDDGFTLPNGLANAVSNASGTSPIAPTVRLLSFLSDVDGTSNVHVLGTESTVGFQNSAFSDSEGFSPTITATPNFTVFQDFTFEVAPGARLNFSNSLSISGVGSSVPEPGTALSGLAMAGLCGMVRRRREKAAA